MDLWQLIEDIVFVARDWYCCNVTNLLNLFILVWFAWMFWVPDIENHIFHSGGKTRGCEPWAACILTVFGGSGPTQSRLSAGLPNEPVMTRTLGFEAFHSTKSCLTCLIVVWLKSLEMFKYHLKSRLLVFVLALALTRSADIVGSVTVRPFVTSCC